MSSSNLKSSSSDVLVAHGILYDRKITRKQGKNKNVQNKLHKPQCGNAARIKLFWPQELSKPKELTEIADEVPLCYKVNSEKEKLTLCHAENFRQQLSIKYPTRTPPLLAATNEYGIQKPVCSFIRPSASPYPELTDWRGIAKFVSDHLQLQPLNTPTQLAAAVGSAREIVRRAGGHCLELACVLVSLLLGAGYNALLVSGYASRRLCLHVQTREPCPYLLPAPRASQIVDSEGAKASTVKYVVQSRKQFTSRYLNSMQAQEEKKIEELFEQKREEQRLRIEEEERLPPDPLYGRRVHCWVLLLPADRVRSDVEKPFYLEPSSGKAFDIHDGNHMAVESVWNHLNFWFNIHTSQPSLSSFNLNEKNSWIPLLNDDEISRNLDMPFSWMEKINISGEAYKTRYPNGCKTVLYKRSKLELFAELSRDDGLVARITQYSDLEWTQPLQELYEYKHRQDLLQQTKLDLVQQRGTDFYNKGRVDHIKEHDYSLSEDDQERKIHFFNCSHPEGLSSLCVQPNCILETYEGHGDFLKQRLMNFKLQDKQFIVEETVEHLQLSPGLPENKQVAKRKYFHLENKIFLTFHHAPDQISAGYLHFIKPSEEGKFGVEHVHEYEPLDMPHNKGQENEMKYLMEKQMEAEIKVLGHAGQIHTQIQNLLDNLRKDRDNPGLKTSVFDEERNHNMVHLMQLRERELLAQAMMELVDPADPLAPLLERDDNIDAACLTPSKLAALKQECEKDIKQSLKRMQNSIELEIIKLKTELEECQNQSVILADKELEESISLKIQALEYRLKRLDPDKY